MHRSRPHQSAYPPHPLPLRPVPASPRSVRVLRGVGSVLLACGLLALIIALGWAMARNLGHIGLVWLVPPALVLLGIGLAFVVRRYRL
jgi:hypothetical protein